jgi:DNA-binding CsgD family transcriptional regulator
MILLGVGLSILLVLAIGLVVSRKVEGDSGRYLVAGRTLGLPLVAAGLMAQAVDSNATLGNTDLAYGFGFWAGASLPIGLALCLLLTGIFFAKPMNAAKLLTLPDWYARRYGRQVEVGSSVLMVVAYVVLLAGNLVAGGFLFEHFLGIDYTIGVLLIVAVVLTYTVAGGMFADAYTAAAQMAITLVATAALVIWVAHTYGQTVTEGKGPRPKDTDVVRVHYKGTLLDGKTFDSSYDRGEPATFPLGGVIPGWREGLALMPVGSKYKLWIPASIGYGEAGTIVQGELVDTCGGGVSQFGTTTFNAAFFAGVQLDQWKAHSWYFTRYPMGREATLNYPELDVKFTNTTDGAIIVKTTYTGTSITVSVYGQPLATTVRAEHGSPSNHRNYSTQREESSDRCEGDESVTKAGAGGFMLKSAPPEQLVSAIRIVAAGDTLLAPAVTRRLLEDFTRRPPPGQSQSPLLNQLTERETEILRLIAAGASNQAIADTLHVSVSTVKTHINHLFRKLDLRERVQAVILAYETGLVRPGDPGATHNTVG